MTFGIPEHIRQHIAPRETAYEVVITTRTGHSHRFFFFFVEKMTPVCEISISLPAHSDNVKATML